MGEPTVKRLTAMGAAIATLALVGCSEETPPSPSIPAARPQVARLDWVEHMPDQGPPLMFGLSELRVGTKGWEADISLENRTRTGFEIPPEVESSDRAFGLMLFTDGELSTVDENARNGTMPPVRVAWTTKPPTPGVLAPGAVWRGTISAPGRLQSGAFVRVSFGPFSAVGDAPEGFPTDQFTWITDHAYRLR